ncbi:hypothetical protein FSP39_022643 [Pinctada imbricata]|uniref:Uncharacterized protein n=1 Tax=Pinctada imbricata TaxID=66713 RepID=A0AA89C659_PINIB|nr:hypothetical protein FSP39_022643 [Pinctada imbricata]
MFKILKSCVKYPIKHSKTVLPTTKLTIYGIEVDSIAMESRLPEDKLYRLRSLLQDVVHRKKLTLQELQSIIGLLNFACLVVPPGRAFLRRLIDLTCNVHKPFHFIRLNKEAKADLRAWQIFIENFNGKSVFLDDEWIPSDVLSIYTDASGSLGYAAVFGANWFALPWLEEHQQFQITVKELFPIVLLLELWGEQLQNKKILFFSDNIAVVQIINKQSSKEKTLMKLLRRLVLVSLRYNILFKAKHIPGKLNIIADHLSRLKFQEARKAAPWLNLQPSVVPQHLIHI